MRRGAFAAAALALALAAMPRAAAAEEGTAGWDGTNPFNCTLQQLGTGTDFPQPDADPFCVEYDKRHQNVTEGGVVQFLSQEPARFAAAGPKCFYFQHDHWVGSVVQGDPATQTYAWDGSYYFDKAKGTGGAYVENFTFNGQTGDPTQLPGFPEAYKPYFGNGRGGVQRTGDVPADPNCVAKANEKSPYRSAGGGPGTGATNSDKCRVPGGRVYRGIAGIKLGWKRVRVRQALGLPTTESSRYLTYCMTGGGRVAAAFDRSGAAGRVVLVVTDSAPFDERGVRVGTRSAKAKRKLKGHRGIAKSTIALRRKRDVLVAGLSKGRVAFLASASRKISAKRTARFLAKAP
jgi:hypothetical protein